MDNSEIAIGNSEQSRTSSNVVRLFELLEIDAVFFQQVVEIRPVFPGNFRSFCGTATTVFEQANKVCLLKFRPRLFESWRPFTDSKSYRRADSCDPIAVWALVSNKSSAVTISPSAIVTAYSSGCFRAREHCPANHTTSAFSWLEV